MDTVYVSAGTKGVKVDSKYRKEVVKNAKITQQNFEETGLKYERVKSWIPAEKNAKKKYFKFEENPNPRSNQISIYTAGKREGPFELAEGNSYLERVFGVHRVVLSSKAVGTTRQTQAYFQTKDDRRKYEAASEYWEDKVGGKKYSRKPTGFKGRAAYHTPWASKEGTTKTFITYVNENGEIRPETISLGRDAPKGQGEVVDEA